MKDDVQNIPDSEQLRERPHRADGEVFFQTQVVDHGKYAGNQDKDGGQGELPYIYGQVGRLLRSRGRRKPNPATVPRPRRRRRPG